VERLVAISAIGLAALSAPAYATSSDRKAAVRIRASAGQLLQLADRYLRSGETAKAETILVALSADPNAEIRNEARFRLARMLGAVGETVSTAVMRWQLVA